MAQTLFSNYRTCSICGKLLEEEHEKEICQGCEETELFLEVKDYIRDNDVNLQMVAEKFHIPKAKVRDWLQNGRIQYKEPPQKKRIGSSCHRCGRDISEGEYCWTCETIMCRMSTVLTGKRQSEGSRMYFLGAQHGEKR
jgi:RNA polymerase subunit RPABC4/transcription elongation factor Spt4